MMFIHYAISNLEKYYADKIHEFYYIVFLNCVTHLIVGWILGTYHAMLPQFCMTCLYVFCKKEPDQKVNIWGFAFRSANLPWVHLVL